MSSTAAHTNSRIAIQNLTVMDLLAQLISRNDTLGTLQVLSALREVVSPTSVQDAEVEAPAADIASTIQLLIDNNNTNNINNNNNNAAAAAAAAAENDQENADLVVLMAAAKHGYFEIVDAALTDNDAGIAAATLAKLRVEANKYVACAEVQDTVEHTGATQSEQPVGSVGETLPAPSAKVRAYKCTHKYLHTYSYTLVYTYTNTHILTHLLVRTCLYTHTHNHIPIYILIHACIHTYSTAVREVHRGSL